MHPSITALMDLFEGYHDAHGIYHLTPDVTEKTERGKIVGKPASVKGEVDAKLWQSHLDGQQGLGIIPINGDSKVKFAAIDVDEYPLDLIALNKNLRDNNLPLIICRTKSGGAHLYLFLDKFYEARRVQDKMREFAAFLGYGDSEIFPKQVKILVSRGDLGNWINMPYFDYTKTLRYAIGPNGKAMQLEEFVKFAESLRQSLDTLAEIQTNTAPILPDGPPCLQHLCKQGFPEGTRNNGLFNLGVYAIKSNGENYAPLVEAFNSKYMDPQLTSQEVLGVIKSLQRKEYQYTCNTAPLSSYCNKAVCRTMKFGVGGGHIGLPNMGTLTKLNTFPPIWFVDITDAEGKTHRLELTTEDLQKPINFQRRCMEVLNIMPSILKRENWEAMVQKLMESVNVVEMPPDSSPVGLLHYYLKEFCTSRVTGKTHDELLLGKPWTCNGRTYFRLNDFLKYLERMKFSEFKQNRIAMYLRDWGAEKGFFNIKGKGTNVWHVPEFKDKQDQKFDDIPMPGEDVPY